MASGNSAAALTASVDQSEVRRWRVGSTSKPTRWAISGPTGAGSSTTCGGWPGEGRNETSRAASKHSISIWRISASDP